MSALIVLAATVVLTMVLARRYHLDGAADGVAIVGGLPSLYLAWAAYRDAQRGEPRAHREGLSLAQVSDELAAAVQAQWQQEAGVRRLNDPYPLSVQWEAAEQYLAPDWSALVTLATTGAGWPTPRSSSWVSGPGALAGEGKQIADVLAHVPTGRLVILGGPGAGKTMLLVRLLLDLLVRRRPGEPVPVLVTLASWDPAEQSLHEWLIGRLALDHHALAAPAPDDAQGTSRIRAMLARGQILMLLDGLDEMPDAMRSAAVMRINDALRPGERVVLTSRGEAYRLAVRPEAGSGEMLLGAAVIRLRPPQENAVREYLVHGTDDRSGWEPVLAVLGTNAPVGQVLTSPLMVALARQIYSPRPGHAGSKPRDPIELFDDIMTDRSAVAQHLLDAFIPAAYRVVNDRPPSRIRSWTAAKAERWLIYLAHHIENTMRGSDFAWWELAGAVPRPVGVIGSIAAVIFGSAVAFMVSSMFAEPPPIRFLAAVVAAFAAGFAEWLSRLPGGGAPMSGIRWRARGIHRPGRTLRVRLGVVILLIIPVPILIHGAGLLAGVGWVLIFLITFGFRGVYGGISVAASPQVTLDRSRRSAFLWLVIGLPFGSAAGLVYGYAVAELLRPALGVAAAQLGLISGVAIGLVLGLSVGLVRYAWPRWAIARVWLALTGHAPWAIMSFLDDAHTRGVLRQAGAFYQFRHVDLRRRLVDRSDSERLMAHGQVM